MLESHRLELEYGQTRQQMNQLSADIENRAADDPDMDTKLTERRSLWDTLIDIDTRKMAAAEKEDAEAQAAVSRDADTSGWDPELRELHQTVSQVSFMDVVESASKEAFPVAGSAFAEYRSHVLPSLIDDHPGTFPIELLLPRDELVVLEGGEFRAITVVAANAQASQRTIGMRLFAMGEAAYLGAIFPSVPAGDAVFPVITTATLGVSIADDTAETIAAGTITLKRFNALRIQRSYEYAIRESLDVIGLEAAFQADLRGSLMSGLDNIAIDAAITDLTTPTAASSEASLNTYLRSFSNAVDAKAAINDLQVRLLVGLSTYKHAHGKNISNIGTAFDLLPRERFRASAHLAAPVSNDQVAIAYRTGGGVNRFIAPIWRRADILRDPYTQGKSGNVELIGSMYANAGMTAMDTHDELSFQLA